MTTLASPRATFLTVITPIGDSGRFLQIHGHQKPSGEYLRTADHVRRGSVPKKHVFLGADGAHLTPPFVIQLSSAQLDIPVNWQDECQEFKIAVPFDAESQPQRSASPVGSNEGIEQLKEVLHTTVLDSLDVTENRGRSNSRTQLAPTDFHIIAPISKGAYGRVLLARKKNTGRLYAIKAIAKVDVRSTLQDVQTEREILMRMDNPFVVKLHYCFQTVSHLYFVFEYANGGDVASLLETMGGLAEDHSRVYLAELVLALECLHGHNVVHRDLKPANLLIDKSGHILLADFGLSHLEAPKDITACAPITVARMCVAAGQVCIVGTPDYVAPEVVHGGPATFASDWWSLGVIAFELLTGCPPFNADTIEHVFDNIVSGEIPWGEELTAEAREFIDALLQRDPVQRLGVNGAREVKKHPFFEGIQWETLRSRPGFFVPEPSSDDDTSYFSRRFTVTSSELQVLAGTAPASLQQRCSVILTNFTFRRGSKLPSSNATPTGSQICSAFPSAPNSDARMPHVTQGAHHTN